MGIIISQKNLLKESYGFLFEDALLDEIAEAGRFKSVKKGEVLIDVGEEIHYMPLLIEGAIKILREDSEGDEMLLYFLEHGDTCAMTMSCCLGATKSKIRAVAERNTQLLMIPVKKMAEWTQQYTSWMSFVFDSYQVRLNEMLESIDSLAFLNMHERLFKYLSDKVKVNQSTTLEITHQDIAYDLHTSRVVVSRLLKQMEREKKIALHRNRIEVLKY